MFMAHDMTVTNADSKDRKTLTVTELIMLRFGMSASVTNCMKRKEPNLDFQELWTPETKTCLRAETALRLTEL